MPAALDCDWDAVRSLAIQIGVREAARQFGIPEGATLMRASREGWLDHLHPQPAPKSIAPIQRRDENGTVVSVVKGSQATLNVLQKLGGRTKLGLAKGLAAGADHVAGLSGCSVLESARGIAALARAASDVHGWAGQSGASVSVRLELLDSTCPPVPAIEVESEVVEQSDSQ